MKKNTRLNKKVQKEEPIQQKEQQKAKKTQTKLKQQKFSLYVFFQVDQKATAQQIKKQYKKLVLRYHPDKNRQDSSAREKFQKLKQAYDILSDPQKRANYDQTGTLGDEQDNSFQTAYTYFRNMFKEVTVEDIQAFQKQYRFGQMEKEDLNDYYQKHQGDMTRLIESIPLSLNQDIPRFIQYFQEQISNKSLKKYKNFDKTKNHVKPLQDQTQEFNQQKQKKNKKQKQDMNSLILAIRGKKQNQMDFLTHLQKKYDGGQRKKVKKQDLPQRKKSKPKK